MKDHNTPLQSIRLNCLCCCNQQMIEVRLCPSWQCPTWAYRMNKCPTDRTNVPKTAIRAIKARCLDCVGTLDLVKKCDTTDCALHPYRLGRNPNIKRTGAGNVEALKLARARRSAEINSLR